MYVNGHTKPAANGNGAHTIEQALPHSIEAEEATLGGIIIDPDAYYDVSEFLRPEHFYRHFNGQIYKAIGDLRREGVAVDLITLAETLRARGVEHHEAIEIYLTGLLGTVPTSMNTRHYGRIVESAALRRRMFRAASEVAKLALDEGQAIASIIEQAERAVLGVSEQVATTGITSIKDGMSNLFDLTTRMYESGGEMVGLPTGFIDLDRLLEGLKGSDLYVLAGRPGMGKSALKTGIILNAGKMGKRIASFSLEMPDVQEYQRMISLETGIELKRLRRGQLDDRELPIFNEAIGRLSQLRVWVDDTPSLTPSQLHARCRRLHMEHGLDLIAVDYLQLMNTDGTAGNRTQEVGQISRSLKRLAMELDVPVLALAQLSRAVEQRGDKHPQLSDLRESGDIENDADCVMFIYRDEYYYPDTTDRPNIAEITVAKHRNGPTGAVDLYFNGKYVRFKNLQRQEIRF